MKRCREQYFYIQHIHSTNNSEHSLISRLPMASKNELMEVIQVNQSTSQLVN